MDNEYFDVNDCNGYGCYVDIESKYMLSDDNEIIYLKNIVQTHTTNTLLMDKLYPTNIQRLIDLTQKQEDSNKTQPRQHFMEQPFINHVIWSMVIVYICLNF